MSETAKSKWLAVYLVLGVAGLPGVLVLLGSTPFRALLIVLAAICPALLVWIYFRPAKERAKDPS